MLNWLLEFWKELLAPQLRWAWYSLNFWRVSCVSLLTVVAVAFLYRKTFIKYITERLKRQREHDTHVFSRANGVLSEEKLIEILDYIETNDAATLSDTSLLRSFGVFFTEVGNSFLDSKVQKTSDGTRDAIADLLAFIKSDFFSYPGGSGQMCLRPMWNVDREGTGRQEERIQYKTVKKNLEQLIEKVSSAYREYRGVIKRRLFL